MGQSLAIQEGSVGGAKILNLETPINLSEDPGMASADRGETVCHQRILQPARARLASDYQLRNV